MRLFLIIFSAFSVISVAAIVIALRNAPCFNGERTNHNDNADDWDNYRRRRTPRRLIK